MAGTAQGKGRGQGHVQGREAPVFGAVAPGYLHHSRGRCGSHVQSCPRLGSFSSLKLLGHLCDDGAPGIQEGHAFESQVLKCHHLPMLSLQGLSVVRL